MDAATMLGNASLSDNSSLPDNLSQSDVRTGNCGHFGNEEYQKVHLISLDPRANLNERLPGPLGS
jgi:hypothetical protein